MPNRVMAAKTAKMKARARDHVFGSAKRWGDPRPVSRPEGCKGLQKQLSQLRIAKKALRRLIP